jgi:hypothetical protein
MNLSDPTDVSLISYIIVGPTTFLLLYGGGCQPELLNSARIYH